jgi:transcriptional regulator with XRE-family HTH domain
MTKTILAERLKLIREQYGVSQRELATRCGIGERQIWRYENGVSDPSASHLKKIACELHASIDYLLGLVDEPVGHYHGSPLSQHEHEIITYVRERDVEGLMRAWLKLAENRKEETQHALQSLERQSTLVYNSSRKKVQSQQSNLELLKKLAEYNPHYVMGYIAELEKRTNNNQLKQ